MDSNIISYLVPNISFSLELLSKILQETKELQNFIDKQLDRTFHCYYYRH